ncbi:MAG: hypothetical protein GAK31_02582 [Stenotrophomonas maltophilia]|uniref:HTH marR-type domain-containing protein n=1 Tax=Stenotrophomonas maltophilia TaxID=40324 RepID=A0A7V8JLJ2_STEMA|nr:MAG: hypothetical protein GAK31_02582 [Stenotrophomonas maltophilia]
MATAALRPSDQCYCLASRRSARYLTRLYERHLAPLQMTSSQFSVLSILHHEGRATVAVLAAALEMERTTLVRALKPMKLAGWVNDAAAVKAGRAAVLTLTAAGRRKLERGIPLWQAAQQEFEDEVGRDAADRMRTLALAALTRRMD